MAIDQILRNRDELAFRIEMARMSGLALEIDQYREQSEAMPFFLRHLLRDLRQFTKLAPREAISLRERLAQAMQPHDQTGSFKVTLTGDESTLSSLAVR